MGDACSAWSCRQYGPDAEIQYVVKITSLAILRLCAELSPVSQLGQDGELASMLRNGTAKPGQPGSQLHDADRSGYSFIHTGCCATVTSAV